jgi:hypothetical protein
MHQYLQDTDFATLNLFRLATDEERELDALKKKLAVVANELAFRQWDFQSSDLNEDFSDAYVMTAHARASKVAQEAHRVKDQVARLETSIAIRQYAIQAVAGAILQIAKQGVSLVHGERTAAPPGRTLGTLAVRDIVWQARNQSMHHEDRKPFNEAVKKLFSILEREHGEQFSLAKHAKQNMAKQVLDVLGWSSYETYLHDMTKLLP